MGIVTTEADQWVQQAEARAIAAEKVQAGAEAVAATLRVVVTGFQQAAGSGSNTRDGAAVHGSLLDTDPR